MKWDVVKTKEILSYLCKLLEISFFHKMSKLIASLLLNGEISYQSQIPCHMLKTFHICCLSLYWALSNFVDLCWEFIMLLKIKVMYTPPNMCYTSTLEVSKNMPSHFYQIILHVFKHNLSPSFSQMRHQLYKNIEKREKMWTHERPWVKKNVWTHFWSIVEQKN